MRAAKVKFESPLPHINTVMKPTPVAGFIIYKNNSVKTVSNLYFFRKPKIVKAKHGWYVQYHYMIPVELRPDYDGKKWLRFRVKEDMNRRKGEEREEYALWLRNELEESLKKGYNPFKPEIEMQEHEEVEKEKQLYATEAIELFLEAWNKRGLQPESLSKYQKVGKRLIAWLKQNKIQHTEITNVTHDHIESFLQGLKKSRNFSNREFNNHLNFTKTIFNYLQKKKYIVDNPCAEVEKLKAKTSKHKFYDDKSWNDLIKVMTLEDPYVLLAFQTTYYLCIRSDKELRSLKVGDIKFDHNRVLSYTKGNSERYIPLDDNIKELFLKHGVNKYPSHYFVFGINGTPAEKPFGRGFFSKRFRKLRERAGFNKDFSIYGAKHQRVIDLKQSGLDDATIMALTGHQDFTAYATYLRNLGLNASPERLNKVSRKI